ATRKFKVFRIAPIKQGLLVRGYEWFAVLSLHRGPPQRFPSGGVKKIKPLIAAHEQPLLDRGNPEHLVLELARRGPCARAVIGAERHQTVPGGENIHAVLLVDCRVAVFGQWQLRATQPRAAPQDATRPRVQTNRPIGADVEDE